VRERRAGGETAVLPREGPARVQDVRAHHVAVEQTGAVGGAAGGL